MASRAKRPIRTMRRNELENEARRLGVQNISRYNVRELRTTVAARIARGSI